MCYLTVEGNGPESKEKHSKDDGKPKKMAPGFSINFASLWPVEIDKLAKSSGQEKDKRIL